MTCKECKGTRTYQPLLGPSEPCRACSDTSISADTVINVLYPISALKVHDIVTPGRVDKVMRNILRWKGFTCQIKVNKAGVVTQGAPTVLALRQLKVDFPDIYSQLVLGDMINITQEVPDHRYLDEVAALDKSMSDKSFIQFLPKISVTSYGKYLDDLKDKGDSSGLTKVTPKVTPSIISIQQAMNTLHSSAHQVRRVLQAKLPTNREKLCAHMREDVRLLLWRINQMKTSLESI